MTFSLDLPAGPVAEAALSVVRTSESPSIANHSLRSFFFAQLLAAHEGCLDDAAYDRELLFAATVMHDLGLGGLARGADRFEVEARISRPRCCGSTVHPTGTSTASGRRSPCTPRPA